MSISIAIRRFGRRLEQDWEMRVVWHRCRRQLEMEVTICANGTFGASWLSFLDSHATNAQRIDIIASA